jgi:DNA-binding response OmpR family regulator
MKNKENFNILIIEIGSNKSNLIYTTLTKKGYKCFVADTLELSYDILRMELIDLVIINASHSEDFEKSVIMDVQNLTDCGIAFLTPEHDIAKMEEFSTYNLLMYSVKLGNLLNIINDIDALIGRLISNSYETILVVKGKNEIRDVIAELLRLRRYDVVLCQNGASAWKKLERLEQLSLVLIDINLPDMDGMDILKKAKRIQKNHSFFYC